jgi:curli biogenesis system outer membrane secretion channel CsgG
MKEIRMGWRRVLATVLLFASFDLATAAEKATIAVLPFEIAETLEGSFGSVESGVLTDTLARALVNTRKFTVVDRSRLERVRREQKFGASGLVAGSTAARVGRLLGADYLVVGSITDFSAEPPREMAYGSGWTRPVRISIELQVLDSSSGQVVAARRASATAQQRVASEEAAAGVPRAALEKAAEELAQEGISAIVGVAFPMKILDVADGDIRLNRGEDGTLSVGDVLNCYAASGKRLVDPDTKEALGTRETRAGSVRVTEILAKMSVARIVDDGGLATGQECRADAEAADATGTHRAPPPPGPIHSY